MTTMVPSGFLICESALAKQIHLMNFSADLSFNYTICIKTSATV